MIWFKACITVHIFMWDVISLVYLNPHLFNLSFYIICSFSIPSVFFVLSNIVPSIIMNTVWLNFDGLWYEIGIWNTKAGGTATARLCIQFVIAAQPNVLELHQTVAQILNLTLIQLVVTIKEVMSNAKHVWSVFCILIIIGPLN